MVQIENFEVWIKGVKTPKKGVKSVINKEEFSYENPYKPYIFL